MGSLRPEGFGDLSGRNDASVDFILGLTPEAQSKFGVKLTPEQQMYQTYKESYPTTYGADGNPLGYTDFISLYKALGGITPNQNNSGLNNFNLASFNQMGTGALPSMKAANTSADLYNKYMPAPFTLEANTPKVVPTQRGLTYNNPYNTNPYLPMANPFALIANPPTSGS